MNSAHQTTTTYASHFNSLNRCNSFNRLIRFQRRLAARLQDGLRPGRWLMLASWLALAAPSALAQSVCASDGQRPAKALLERFMPADCADCWTRAPAPAAGSETLALDWVLPGLQGDEAALSAVATRDGLDRLEALDQAAVSGPWEHSARVAAGGSYRLRVAHGVAFNGYLGVSIAIQRSPPRPASAKSPTLKGWLALVETLPAGTEGSPVERYLVRNLFQTTWNMRRPPAVQARSMAVSEGANPDRLSLIGWLEDDQGRLLAVTQSRCAS